MWRLALCCCYACQQFSCRGDGARGQNPHRHRGYLQGDGPELHRHPAGRPGGRSCDGGWQRPNCQRRCRGHSRWAHRRLPRGGSPVGHPCWHTPCCSCNGSLWAPLAGRGRGGRGHWRGALRAPGPNEDFGVEVRGVARRMHRQAVRMLPGGCLRLRLCTRPCLLCCRCGCCGLCFRLRCRLCTGSQEKGWGDRWAGEHGFGSVGAHTCTCSHPHPTHIHPCPTLSSLCVLPHPLRSSFMTSLPSPAPPEPCPNP